MTGRAGREAFNRQARDGQRVEAARAKLAALKAELRAERSAYSDSQVKDRAALIERHGRDDQQLKQAIAARQGMDRAAEVTARREQVRTPERERDHGRSIGIELSP